MNSTYTKVKVKDWKIMEEKNFEKVSVNSDSRGDTYIEAREEEREQHEAMNDSDITVLYKRAAGVLNKEKVFNTEAWYLDLLQEMVIVAWKVYENPKYSAEKKNHYSYIKMLDKVKKFKRNQNLERKHLQLAGLQPSKQSEAPNENTEEDIYTQQILAKILTAGWLTEQQYTVMLALYASEGDKETAARMLKKPLKHIQNICNYIKEKVKEEKWLL